MAKYRKQIAALPWRRHKGQLEVLLITSRETKRWVIPKGWPMDHLMDFNAAKQEAFEEAGVTGRVRRKAVGRYDYDKRDELVSLPCRVDVYALEVEKELARWPERKERKREWFKPHEAALRVQETELKHLLLAFSGR
jgi:8-oxo-dGTP pyrophosphatase MutT (NUDIX family)